jgi:hypothetical protein
MAGARHFGGKTRFSSSNQCCTSTISRVPVGLVRFVVRSLSEGLAPDP